MNNDQDIKYMQRALNLAVQGRGRTSPNPMVGAVVVKENEIIGEGYHQKAGTAHAEVIALQAAGEAARGATLYVTLEPCPMCAGALILARLSRLVFAAFDSQYGCCGSRYALPMDPAFHHRVACEGGLLASESEALLNAFFSRHREQGPI
jgi:diaminohydroxyphosphoribosylaminopyrimidine deaminase/5-amino-6-(5-phosphoribosylamino)uracil reductase